jgi:transposase
MSVREADQAAVLARVVAGTLRLGEGAELLGVSYRHAKRLLARYRRGGARARLRPSG